MSEEFGIYDKAGISDDMSGDVKENLSKEEISAGMIATAQLRKNKTLPAPAVIWATSKILGCAAVYSCCKPSTPYFYQAVLIWISCKYSASVAVDYDTRLRKLVASGDAKPGQLDNVHHEVLSNVREEHVSKQMTKLREEGEAKKKHLEKLVNEARKETASVKKRNRPDWDEQDRQKGGKNDKNGKGKGKGSKDKDGPKGGKKGGKGDDTSTRLCV